MAFGIPIAIWIAAGEFAFSAITQAMAPTAQTGRLAQNDFHSLNSSYALPLPKCWGVERVAGNITWVSEVREHKYTVGQNMFGGGGTDIFYYTQDVEYSYTLGPAQAFLKIWLGDKVIYNNSAVPDDSQSGAYGWQGMFQQVGVNLKAKDRLFESYELFLGTETQQPSQIVGAAEGFGSVPADRGVVKCIIKNLNITLLGNALPAGSATIQFAEYVPSLGPAETLTIFPTRATDATPDNWWGVGATWYDGVSPTTANIYRTHSGPLDSDTFVALRFSGFSADGIPADATISGIYPKVTMSRVAMPGTLGLLGVVTVSADSIYNIESTSGAIDPPFEHQTFGGVSSGISIGSTLAAISSAYMDFSNASSIPAGGGYGDQSTVESIGLEVQFQRPLIPPTGTTLGAILADLFQTAGFTSSQYDIASNVGSIPVKGFKTEQKAIRDVVRELAEIYPFDVRETDRKISVIHRAGASVKTIAEDDFVLTGSDETAYRLSEPITQENEIPMKAEVHYADIDRDFQDNVQYSKRIIDPEPTMESISVKSLSTNVVMNADEAAQAAERIMWEPWATRRGGKCQLLPKYLLVDPGDKVTYSYKGQSLLHRIKEENLGAGFGLELTSVSHDSDIYTSSALGGSNGSTFPVPLGSFADPGSVNPPVIFEAPASMVPSGAAGMLIIQFSGADPDYGGCEVFLSVDGGISYSSLKKIAAAVTGYLISAFPSSGDPDTVDTLSIDATESNVSIDPATQSEADSFSNPAYVGTSGTDYELVCPTNSVERETAGLFDLGAYIRRGVLGSTIEAHPVGSRYADLNGAIRLAYSSAWVGLTLYFKGAAFNSDRQMEQSVPDCVAYPYTIAGAAVAVSVDGAPISTTFVATIDGSGPFTINGAGA